MSELSAWVQQGLGQAIVAVLPLVLAALVGSVVAGGLAARLGLGDPVVAVALRGLAVVGALVLLAEGLAGQAQGLAAEAWSQLGAVGRAER